jgi:hypothetical protein
MEFSLLEHGWMNPKVTGEVSIDVLQILIKHNKHQDKIKRLHTLVKGSDEYDRIKEKLPCVKPHGIFDGYGKEENFKKFSGYIFFDIDSGDMRKHREILLAKHSDKIYMLGKSVGGNGLFFYIKVGNHRNLTKENFINIQNYFIKKVFADVDIDLRAKGISRNQVIPFDSDLYVNDNAIVVIPDYIFDSNSNVDVNQQSVCKGQCINKINKCYTLNFTSSKYIDYATLCKQLIIHTPVDFPNNEMYIIKEIDIVRVPVWRMVTTGYRHMFFKWQINALMYLNKNISLLEVESFIHFWNQYMTDEPLEKKDFKRTVQLEYNRLKEGGQNFAKVVRRKIHTNPAYENRRATANQVRADITKQETMNKMREAINQIISKDGKLTKAAIAKLTGISRQTITKYFNEVVNDLAPNNSYDLKPTTIISGEQILVNSTEIPEKQNACITFNHFMQQHPF